MKHFIFAPSNEYSIQSIQAIGFSPEIKYVTTSEELLKKETPVQYIDRITTAKAESIWKEGVNILAVHKSVFVGRRLIVIPQNEAEAGKILQLYAGQNHIVYTGILLKRSNGTASHRRAFTRIKLRNLDAKNIDEFIASNQWQNEIGGYNPNGLMQKHIIKITGSYTGFLGFPSYEASNLINQM
jgi:predicted house-cleaning NTP pyrophosphatase (Maf/HAM1 superfamily)